MNRPAWISAFVGPPPDQGQNGDPRRSRSQRPGTGDFHDLRSAATPTRWHPEYQFQNGNAGSGHPQPPKSPTGLSVTPFLSTIHEDIPSIHIHKPHQRHSDTEPPRSGLLGNGLDTGVAERRRYSESDLQNPPDRGRYLKKSQRDGEERSNKPPRRNNSGDLSIISDGPVPGLLSVPSSRTKRPLSNGDSGIEADSKSDLSFRSTKSASMSRSDRSRRSSTRSEPGYLKTRRNSGISDLDRGSSSRLSQSRRARSDSNISAVGRSSVGGSSRRPSTVDFIVGSTVSAEMVAENPTLAASRAFASIEIPVDLLDTTSKRLKKIFGPVIMCALVITLAASLGAAVYFAVVLNNAQASEIEFLRVTLRLQLEGSSADRLLNLTVAETVRFKEQYCKEINDYYKGSSLASTYQGCEVASVQGGEIRLVLYFESGSRSSQNEASESAILQVLASSAPRVGQTENGVVSINNVHVNLTSAAIDVEETTEVPEFVNTGGDVSGWHPVSRVALSSTTVAPGRQTTGTANSRTTSADDKSADPLHPCAPGESRTHYRYPQSCGIFFQCLNGSSIVLSCGKDLVFDITRKVCVKEVTDCQEPEDADLGIDPELLHPCETKGGVYHPHPRACNLFIHCDNFKSYVRICPHGLVFDMVTETCVHLHDNFTCPQETFFKQDENTEQTLEQMRNAPEQGSMQKENKIETIHSGVFEDLILSNSASEGKAKT